MYDFTYKDWFHFINRLFAVRNAILNEDIYKSYV